jgi:hypothetical protein
MFDEPREFTLESSPLEMHDDVKRIVIVSVIFMVILVALDKLDWLHRRKQAILA